MWNVVELRGNTHRVIHYIFSHNKLLKRLNYGSRVRMETGEGCKKLSLYLWRWQWQRHKNERNVKFCDRYLRRLHNCADTFAMSLWSLSCVSFVKCSLMLANKVSLETEPSPEHDNHISIDFIWTLINQKFSPSLSNFLVTLFTNLLLCLVFSIPRHARCLLHLLDGIIKITWRYVTQFFCIIYSRCLFSLFSFTTPTTEEKTYFRASLYVVRMISINFHNYILLGLYQERKKRR